MVFSYSESELLNFSKDLDNLSNDIQPAINYLKENVSDISAGSGGLFNSMKEKLVVLAGQVEETFSQLSDVASGSADEVRKVRNLYIVNEKETLSIIDSNYRDMDG